MRPLRLDIAGFAAFRDPVTVDFTDADYFALTGPTGSGKSTVIDAMTFALYGSAPRWGRDNAIRYALAPTANRCTVRLVFELADQRYVVAREVRRSGQQVIQKNPRLERYLDPTATGDPEADEPTESLAADARSMRAEVVELLGLDFEDFCTCVVLPQGDFATFLKASVAERQAILLKLLGARHYEAIGRRANRRASDAQARIDALQGQLTGYAEATSEAENAARDHEQRLGALAATVTAEVGELADRLAARPATAGEVDRLVAEIALLTAVAAPADIDELLATLARADAAYADADAAERAARALSLAAEQALVGGPQPAPLEETLRWRAEWDRESARRPELTRLADQALATLDAVRERAADVDQELDQARDDHDRLRAELQAAAQAVSTLEQRITLLRSVDVPDGTDDLDRATASARRAVEDAVAELERADAAAITAGQAVATLPERSALTALERTVDAYADAAAQHEELSDRLTATADELAAGEQVAARTLANQQAARDEVERLRTQATAADLRPHLVVGHACPVCDHQVEALPPALPVPELDAARRSATEAERAHRAAADVVDGLRHQLTTLTAQTEALATRRAELDRTLSAELPGTPGGADRDPALDRSVLAELVSRLQQAQQTEQQALRAQARARQAVRSAEQDRERIAADTRSGWARLHATSGQLADLGAPPVTAAGLAEAWTGLRAWSSGLADRLTAADLVEAVSARDRAAGAVETAAARLRTATTAAKVAHDELTATAVRESQARDDLTAALRRLAELEELLADRPTADVAREQLAEHQRLASAAATARAQAQAAAGVRQHAEAERERRRADRDQARAMLHRVREPLVPLGAPAVDDTDLSAAWTTLLDWAPARAADHRDSLADREKALDDADAEAGQRLARLSELVGSAGLAAAVPTLDELAVSGGLARLQRLPTEIELAAERARAATAEVGRRRREAEKLRSTIAAETETEQVARQLALLMSAKRFPQWLADAALDTLVADASASLLALSSGQFELTHDRGEFFVVDHADADSLRSVKTLSGGETFQASLALALALSEQLSTLAAGGRTTLDSIFLDEGFGTLDPDALEIVAGTLENLAQGRRMVGVVTHVAALAERVPVRFEVSRDSRTSTIERIGS